jgi:hypothetical protein
MSKQQLRDFLSDLLPYVGGRKQRLALFTVALLLALSPFHAFDSPHLHVDDAPTGPTVNVRIFASGNSTATVTTYTPWW